MFVQIVKLLFEVTELVIIEQKPQVPVQESPSCTESIRNALREWGVGGDRCSNAEDRV